jgi:hypothetical protein
MHYLAEDPWPATLAFGVIAAACVIALRVTQQGKYLVAAATFALLAGLVWLVDALWVTDAERVEAMAYGIVQAVRDINPPTAADPDKPKAERPVPNAEAFNRLFSYLTPDATFELGEFSAPGDFAKSFIRRQLENTTFDFIRVSKMYVEVGQQSRTAKTHFIVHAGGSTDRPGTRLNFLTDGSGTEWEFGLRETEPGTWKINRITAVRLPAQSPVLR